MKKIQSKAIGTDSEIYIQIYGVSVGKNRAMKRRGPSPGGQTLGKPNTANKIGDQIVSPNTEAL